VISTRLGKVRGLDTGKVQLFLGLRYGEPPTGPLRFLPPVAASNWRGVREATEYPNRAMQECASGTDGRAIAGPLSEDCLFLNVVRPAAQGSRRPVMFWIHGGGYFSGSANEYDGSVLAEQGDVVVVSVNFRLGALGFLDLSSCGASYEGSASNGVRDLILALQWVRDNIEDYGGDPENITIFGESSGGSLVLSLLAAPAADTLYHKAIAHSPTSAFMKAADPSKNLAERLQISTADLVDKLLGMSAQEIVDLQLRFRVSIDGEVITRSSFAAIKDRGASGVPILAGSNLREGTLYTQGNDAAADHYPGMNRLLATEMLCGGAPDAYLEALAAQYPDASPGKFHEMIWSDMFRRTAQQAAMLASQAGPGGWLYRFDLPANLPAVSHLGATHGSEIAFTFNTFANPETHARAYHDRNDPMVRYVAEHWSKAVVQFAKNGRPGGSELPDWPTYDDVQRQCLMIDERFHLESDPDRVHRRLWQQ